LEEAEELENLAGLGGDLVDTTDTDDEEDLGLSGNVEVTGGTGSTLQANLILLLGDVLLDVGFGTLEDDLALGLSGLWKQSQNSSKKKVSKYGSVPKDG
jgi:hypothetical protein